MRALTTASLLGCGGLCLWASAVALSTTWQGAFVPSFLLDPAPFWLATGGGVLVVFGVVRA